MKATLILTTVDRDGSEEFLSSRAVADVDELNLRAEARTAMEQRAELDARNERRMVRNSRPRTVSVRADLKVGGSLIDCDEASLWETR